MTAKSAVTLTRVIDAPAELIFSCFASREHLMRWFGPEGYPVTLCELDFRVGGQVRLAFTGPDGQQQTPFGGDFLAIEPGRLIRFSNGFEGEDEKMIMTWRFEPRPDGRTTVSMETVFASEAMFQNHIGVGFVIGSDSGFDNLERLVLELRPVR